MPQARVYASYHLDFPANDEELKLLARVKPWKSSSGERSSESRQENPDDKCAILQSDQDDLLLDSEQVAGPPRTSEVPWWGKSEHQQANHGA